MEVRHKNNPRLEYGYSARNGDCPDRTKELVQEKIRNKARNAGLSENDVVNLLAIADLESGFTWMPKTKFQPPKEYSRYR